jgi:hypothetical protein
MREAPGGEDEFPLYVESAVRRVALRESIMDTLFMERFVASDWDAVIPDAKLRAPRLSISCVCKLLSIEGPAETGMWSGLYHFVPLPPRLDNELGGHFPLYAKVGKAFSQSKGDHGVYLSHGYDSAHRGTWCIGTRLPTSGIGNKAESYMWIPSSASVPDQINNQKVEAPHNTWMVTKTEGENFLALSDEDSLRQFRITCSLLKGGGTVTTPPADGADAVTKQLAAEKKLVESEEWKAVKAEAHEEELRSKEEASEAELTAEQKVLEASEAIVVVNKAELDEKVDARKKDPMYMFVLVAVAASFISLGGVFLLYQCCFPASKSRKGSGIIGQYQQLSPRGRGFGAATPPVPQTSAMTGASPRRRSSAAHVDMELI